MIQMHRGRFGRSPSWRNWNIQTLWSFERCFEPRTIWIYICCSSMLSVICLRPSKMECWMRFIESMWFFNSLKLWSICIVQESYIVIWNLLTSWLIPVVGSKSVTLGFLAPSITMKVRTPPWLSLLPLDGIEHQKFCSAVLLTPQNQICGAWDAWSMRFSLKNRYFQVMTPSTR